MKQPQSLPFCWSLGLAEKKFDLSKSLSWRSKVLKVFVVFLDLCVVSSDVSEFSVNAQPSISLTLSSTHTPNSPMPLHTTPQPPSIVVPATSLFYCNYIPTTSRRVDGFQNQGFRGNEVSVKGGIRVKLGTNLGIWVKSRNRVGMMVLQCQWLDNNHMVGGLWEMRVWWDRSRGCWWWWRRRGC